jgi:hypothetical protein
MRCSFEVVINTPTYLTEGSDSNKCMVQDVPLNVCQSNEGFKICRVSTEAYNYSLHNMILYVPQYLPEVQVCQMVMHV